MEGGPAADSDPTPSSGDQAARSKTEAHAATPTVTHFDSLGRPYKVVEHNIINGSTDQFVNTEAVLDVEGQTLEVKDALGRTAMTYTYSVLGMALHVDSLDAGQGESLRYNEGIEAHRSLSAWRPFTAGIG